jgi:hypothetical protein
VEEVTIEFPRGTWARLGRWVFVFVRGGLDGGPLFTWRWGRNGVLGVAFGCVYAVARTEGK